MLTADVSEKTKQIVRDSKPVMNASTFPVMFKVTTTEELTDIYTLINCKKRIEAK